MSCPMCSKDTDPKYKPFCSNRCADLDLGKWLTGSYAIPAEEDDAPDEDEMAQAEASLTRH